jgi:hypothetical protein
MGIPSLPKEILFLEKLDIELLLIKNFYGKGETRRGSIGIEY